MSAPYSNADAQHDAEAFGHCSICGRDTCGHCSECGQLNCHLRCTEEREPSTFTASTPRHHIPAAQVREGDLIGWTSQARWRDESGRVQSITRTQWGYLFTMIDTGTRRPVSISRAHKATVPLLEPRWS